MEHRAQLQDKQVLITGANRGLGLAMTRRFLEAGARVLMACRQVPAAHAALKDLAAQGVDISKAKVVALDLSSLADVKSAAQNLSEQLDVIDILLLNAGVFRLPPQLNEDRLERHFAINYLGHFVLTAKLWPKLLQSKGARIVGVSSRTERSVPNRFLNPRSLEGQGPWKSYAFSKRCLLSFMMELDRRLQSQGLPHRALAADPGFVGTSLLSSGGDASTIVGRARNRFMSLGERMGQTPYTGSRPLWHACTASLEGSTGLVHPRGAFGLWGRPGWKTPSKASQDPEFVAQLWALSETFCAFDAVTQRS